MGRLDTPAASITDNRKTVTTAGTREALTTATTEAVAVCIQAETDNTGYVVVGGSTVVAALGTRRGIALAAGEFVTLNVDQLADIYLDVTVNGDGVTYVVLA